jgi:hypothetical protein
MQTKLTLRLDSELIEKVKYLSEKLDISLSRIVSDYFNELVKINDLPEPSSPILDEIMGIIADNGKDYKSYYKEHLKRKYL